MLDVIIPGMVTVKTCHSRPPAALRSAGRGYPTVAAGVTLHKEAEVPSDGGQRWRGGSFTTNRGVLKTIAVTGTKILVDSEIGAGFGDRVQPGTVAGSAAARKRSSANAQENPGMILRRSSSSGAVWRYDTLGQHQGAITSRMGASSTPPNECHEIEQSQQDADEHPAEVGLCVGEARRPSQQCRPSATMGGAGKIFRPLSRTDSREPHLVVHSWGVSGDAPRSEARQSVVETALADERVNLSQHGAVMIATAPRTLEGAYLPRMEVIPGRIPDEVVITLPSGGNRNTNALDLTGGTVNVAARETGSMVGAAVGDEKKGQPCRGREQHPTAAPQQSGHSPCGESLRLEKEMAASGNGTATVGSTSIGGLRTIKMHSSTRAEEYGNATKGRSSHREHKRSITPTQLSGTIRNQTAMEEVAATVAFRITSMDGTRYGKVFAEVKQALMGVGKAKPGTRATSGVATSSGRTTPTKVSFGYTKSYAGTVFALNTSVGKKRAGFVRFFKQFISAPSRFRYFPALEDSPYSRKVRRAMSLRVGGNRLKIYFSCVASVVSPHRVS